MEAAIGVINNISAWWAADMWTALWQSSVLAGGIFVVGYVFKGTPSSVRYWLWMLVGLRLFIMPFVTVELPVLPEGAPQATVTEPGAPTVADRHPASPPIAHPTPVPAAPLVDSEIAEAVPPPLLPVLIEGSSPLTPSPLPAPTLSLTAVLFLLWIGGVVTVLARIAIAWLKTRRLIAAARFGNTRLDNLTRRLGNTFGLRRLPEVGITAERCSPFVSGIRKPVVILPASLVDIADDEKLQVILAHEFAHVHRRDPLFGWFFALCHAFYFFHPLLPFIKRQILLERERACDDWVLTTSNARPGAYGRALVAVAELCSAPQRPQALDLVVGESFQDLKTRLQALSDDRRTRRPLSLLASLLLCLVALLAAPGIVLGKRSADAQPVAEIAQLNVSPTPITAPVPTPEVDVAPANARVLQFPEDRTVGMIRVKDSSQAHHIDTYHYWTDNSDWHDYIPAQGTVTIPPESDAWLILNQSAYDDLQFLENLDPDSVFKLSNQFTDPGAPGIRDEHMAAVANLTGLRELDLFYTDIGAAGLAHLGAFESLERLWLPRQTDNNAMAHVGKLTGLRALYFRESQVTDAGVYPIRNLSNLRELSIGGPTISNRGLDVLRELPRLTYLKLFGQEFSDAGMVSVSQIKSLKILSMQSLNITNQGIGHIAKLPRLERLHLHSVEGINGQCLRDIRNIKTLRMLDLGSGPGAESNVDEYSMAYLAECTSLEVLRPPGHITDEGLAHIAKLPRLKELSIFIRRGGSISDAGLHSIAQLSTLRKLFVQGNETVTDEGLAALANLSRLEDFGFYTKSPSITDAGVAALEKLTNLTALQLTFDTDSNVTMSALSRLNGLTKLKTLIAYGFQQDDSTLDLAPMQALDNLSLSITGGVRDDDMVSLGALHNLRWLQGIEGISDAGLTHIAGLQKMERLFVRSNALTDAGLDTVASLRNLNYLFIGGKFTDDGVHALQSLKGLSYLNIDSTGSLDVEALSQLAQVLPNLQSFQGARIVGGDVAGFGKSQGLARAAGI